MGEFNKQVVSRDKRTGQITGKNPWRMYESKDGQIFEQPPGSGICYSPSGERIKTPERILEGNQKNPTPVLATVDVKQFEAKLRAKFEAEAKAKETQVKDVENWPEKKVEAKVEPKVETPKAEPIKVSTKPKDSFEQQMAVVSSVAAKQIAKEKGAN